MNNLYNPDLCNNSRNLRKNMTKEEKHLWYDFLQSLPVTVNRQKILGRYIADFYCAQAKLVIEIDGSQHFEKANQNHDHARDEFLRSLGIKVLRYTNLDINRRFKFVCEEIYDNIFAKVDF